MKNIFVLVIFSLILKFGFAQNLPSCNSVSSGRCYYNGFVYQGNTQTKDWYSGEALDRKFHGKGSYYYHEEGPFKGNRFEGQFQNGAFFKGTYYFTNGAKYSGEFRNGVRHGFGKDSFIDGSSYEGGYFDGKRQGKGTVIYNNGHKYIGSFQDDKKNGFGVLYFLKQRYEGNFKDDEYHGIGTYFHENGDISIAEYIYGKRSGLGVYLFKNGARYVGEYVNDERSGLGIFYGTNGNILSEGVWQNNKFVSVKAVPSDIIIKATNLAPLPKSIAQKASSSDIDFAKRCRELGVPEGTPDFALCLRSLKK